MAIKDSPDFSEHAALNLSEEDGKLIQAAVRGNVDAFGQLYQKYAPYVHRYIAYRVQKTSEAEDLTA